MEGFANTLGVAGLAGLCLLGPIQGRSDTSRGAEASASELMRLGASEERAGHAAAAADAYAALLRLDTSFESLLTPRLAELSIACGRPAEALSWARRAARRQPAPQAYLAGVHARLGQWKEAELLLRQALAQTGEHARPLRLTLLWQLADAQEAQGNVAAAAATLKQSRESANNDEARATATLRLNALRTRSEATSTNRPPDKADTSAEAQP